MKTKILTLLILSFYALSLSAQSNDTTLNQEWQQAILAAIEQFPDRGGYYTGGKPNDKFRQTTMQALNSAFIMGVNDEKPAFVPSMAVPSFCSSATYAVIVKALLLWDCRGVISKQAWRNIKPYVGIKDAINTNGIFQDDGMGFWGRANANGPGLGVLIHELDAGYSFTAFRGAKNDSVKETPTEQYLSDEQWRQQPIWNEAIPGDLMKIFWNRNESRGHDGGAIIGWDGVKGHLQEAGHSVIFLGINENDEVVYWSSNGPGEYPETMGYSIATCDKTAIQRVVFTRITKPWNFDNARHMEPQSVNRYLMDLNGKRHSTTAEMLQALGID